MQVRFTAKPVGNAARASARIILLSLPFFLLLNLVGQPDLDDRHPLVGARSLSAKVFKQDHSSKSGLTALPQLSLPIGRWVTAPEFYLSFVGVVRRQDYLRAPLISPRSSRSPPRAAAV